MSPSRSMHLLVLVLIGVFMASCGKSPSPTATLSRRLQPSFELRQFDPSAPFFQGAPYPDEVLSIQDAELQPLSCSPEYFSWSGANHEYVNPATGETDTISDPEIQSYLGSAVRLFPDRTIISISLCGALDGPDLVIFRVGPCGGGCAGIPHIAYGERDGTLNLVGEVLPDGDGPYYGCTALQLTTGRLLYLSCLGEGTAIIRRVDLGTGDISIILRCEHTPDNAGCQS